MKREVCIMLKNGKKRERKSKKILLSSPHFNTKIIQPLKQKSMYTAI